MLWPINKLITKRAMVIITKCNRLFHYRVQWQVIRPAILFLIKWDDLLLQSLFILGTMACYCKAWQLFYYQVQGFSTNWTIKTGHPDYSTILAKRFQETFPFSHVFICKEFVANGQNTNKRPTNVPPKARLSSITCSRHVKGVWLLTPNTVQVGGGLTWIALSIMKDKV